MRVEQILWREGIGWNASPCMGDAHLVLYFGGKIPLGKKNFFDELKRFYPQAHIMGCSTGGEIFGPDVYDDSVSVVALYFDKTQLRTATRHIAESLESFDAGRAMAQELNAPTLRHIFLLSDGTHINGSELVRGLYSILAPSVIVTGGLAGDSTDFMHTFVGLDGNVEEKKIAAVGFYGDSVRVSYGCVGGWTPFGPVRTITKSEGNVLYELDGKPALDLYKLYLGEAAASLPSSGAPFPLSIRPSFESKHEVVRTMMAIDESKRAIIFADEVPAGYVAQLMRGEFSMLIEGAAKAAILAIPPHKDGAVAILVSCVGRKIVLGQSISDETEAVAEIFEHKVPTLGFYSYGEICHDQFTNICGLHNETMTVTVIHED